MDKAKLQEVIITDLALRGNGTEGKPYRKVTQFWDKEGNLLAEHDPFAMDEVKEIFKWLLGGSEFPAKREGEGNYYWRSHLRKKIEALGIKIDFVS